MVGSVLALLASWKMHSPDFLAGWSCLTFGRVRPAHMNAVVYGFSTQVAIGVAIWLLCRLGGVPFLQGGLVMLGAVFWDLGGTIGLFAILCGDRTRIEGPRMPSVAG